MGLTRGFWRALGTAVCVALTGAGCAPHAAGVPPGPSPEYEAPPLPPWDAGSGAKRPPESRKSKSEGGVSRD